ncbi:hypothetical protein V9T40_009820 [Parthenolecanium corni]|uniref:Uncharacterized protein n=1 Tax=Parthenolecanium corni TaxID=536013 RepID=A0AAN9T5I0_9HEMI
MKKLQVLDKTYAFYPPILNTLKKERKKKKKKESKTNDDANASTTSARERRVVAALVSATDARLLYARRPAFTNAVVVVVVVTTRRPTLRRSCLADKTNLRAKGSLNRSQRGNCSAEYNTPPDRRAPRERDSPPTIRRKRRVLGPTTRADPSNYFIAYSTMDGDSSDERMIVDLGHGRRPRATPASDGFSPERLRP